MLRRCLTIVVLLLLGANASGVDLVRSRSIGMGRTVLLTNPTPTDQINYAVRATDSLRFRFEAGYHRRFELIDLDHLFLAADYRYRRWTIAFGAAQFGKADLYAEQLLKGSLSYKLTPSLSLTATSSAMQIQIGNGYGGLRAATIGFGAAGSYRSWHFSLNADNLTRSTLVPNGQPFARTGTLLVEFLRPGSYSITARARLEEDEKPQLGLGQMIRLSERSRFFWGLGNEPLEYGGGFEIDIPVGAVAYALSVHPVLGWSHAFSISYRPSGKPSSTEDDF